MLLGRSPFQSVLERLEAENPGTEADPSAGFARIRGLATGLAFDQPGGENFSSKSFEQDYRDNLGETEPAVAAPEPPAIPDHLARTDPDEVAADLALLPEDTSQTLSEKRRLFAKSNHPDGVPAAFREQATLRMTIANSLVDKALRRLSR